MSADESEPLGAALKLSDIYSQHLYGKKGETLFHVPYSNIFGNRTDGMTVFMRMQNYKDDRSKVLLAALACEAIIDMLLREIMPGYKNSLEEERETTLSQKIRILSAFSIVPRHLTRAADMLRAVRNAFAHDLEIDKLEDIKDKIKQQMFQYYTERGISPREGRNDLQNVFEAIAYASTAGLASYLTCVSDLNAVIRSPEFEDVLSKRSEARHQVNIEIVRQHANTAPSEPRAPRREPWAVLALSNSAPSRLASPCAAIPRRQAVAENISGQPETKTPPP